MGTNKFTKEQEKQICKQYFLEEKPSAVALAKRWGCGNMVIQNIIKRNGYKLRTYSEARKGHKGWKKFTKKQEIEICNEYFSEEELSTIKLAKKYSCDSTTIRNIIRRNGYVLRTRSEVNKRQKWSEETRKKMCEKIILHHQNNPGPYKDTKPELKMKDILNNLNIPFEHQFRLGNHLFDFHILNTNILIEVDGDYWHGNPKMFRKLSKMQKKKQQRDIKHNKIAKTNNFILLRFWENDILNNKKVVKEKIYNEIEVE